MWYPPTMYSICIESKVFYDSVPSKKNTYVWDKRVERGMITLEDTFWPLLKILVQDILQKILNSKLNCLPWYFGSLAGHGPAVSKLSHFLNSDIKLNHEQEWGNMLEYVYNTDDSWGASWYLLAQLCFKWKGTVTSFWKGHGDQEEVSLVQDAGLGNTTH